jgi:hypothetical protein
MNKRNTVLVTIVLVVLVVLLIGRGVRHHHRTDFAYKQYTNKVDCLLDLNLATGFDSATVKACDLPIIIHYPKPTEINGSRTQLHVFSLTTDALKKLLSLNRGDVLGDSTLSINIYTKFMSSMSSNVNLLLYKKVSMKESVQYTVTYPVRDSLGIHVVEDSGLVSTEMISKAYGWGSKKSNERDMEKDLTKQLEKTLINDVAKKIKPE